MPIEPPQVGGHASFQVNYTLNVDDDCRLAKWLATTFSDPGTWWTCIWHADNSDVHRDGFESPVRGVMRGSRGEEGS